MGGGGLQHFSFSPKPLGFGFGTKGFGAKSLGPGLDIILIYSISSILTFPRPNSGCLRLALGDFGLWLQLKSDLKVELRLVNTQCCI